MVYIISDTHENIRATEAALEIMRKDPANMVIHCGDIISPPFLDLFRGLPVSVVYGNNDGEREGLKRKCEELGFREIADTLTFEHEGKQVLVNHGTDQKFIMKKAQEGVYDYIFTGHTHKLRDEKIGRTRVINPGALFMAKDYTFARLDFGKDNLEIITVDRSLF